MTRFTFQAIFALFACLALACSSDGSGDDSDGSSTDGSPESEAFDDSWQGKAVGAQADGLWSNPATWDSGEVPKDGEQVTIPAGRKVLLDVPTAALYSLEILGTLEAIPADVGIRAETLTVAGLLQIGTEEEPFSHQATITLTGQSGGGKAELEEGIGRRVLAVLEGGRLELHGSPKTSWTRLGETAPAGADVITVDDATGWEVGDVVALTPSHYRWDETDERTIVEVLGEGQVRLDAPLEHYHFGEMQEIEGYVVDERAEVAVLSRNVVVEGEEASMTSFLGGHMIFLEGSTVHVSSIEARRLGQRGVLGRYPVHWHHAQDATGDYVRDSAVHHSLHRCFTLHHTNHVRLERNVAWDTFGHCFFFEDAVEEENQLLENLGARVRTLPEADRVKNPDADEDDQLDDKHDGRTSVFWITNPANHWIGNVAAGAESGMGFWFDLRTGENDLTGEEVLTSDRRLGTFEDNVAHSISSAEGNNHGYGPAQAGSGLTFEGLSMVPELGEGVAERFTAYKCQNHGIWADGAEYVRDAILVGNRVGYANNHFFEVTRLVGALIAGESLNRPHGVSNAEEPPSSLSFSGPTGVEFIKGQSVLEDVTFVDFQGLDEKNVALRVHEQYGKANQWVSGLRFVRSELVSTKEDEEPSLFLLPDWDGGITGTRGTLYRNGGDLGMALDDSCEPLSEPFAGFSRCPYMISMFEVGIRGGEDGETYTINGQVSSGGWTPVRTEEAVSIGALAADRQYDLFAYHSPERSILVNISADSPRVFHHQDPTKNVPRSDPTSTLPEVASVAALDAVTETSVAPGEAPNSYVLRLFGWEPVIVCSDTYCE